MSVSTVDLKFNGLPKLPAGWRWERFSDLCERVSVGHVGPTSEHFCPRNDGVLFIRSQDVRPGRLMHETAAAVTRDFHAKLKKSQLRPGDVLIVRVGANRGDCCVVPDGLGELNCANIVFARPKDKDRILTDSSLGARSAKAYCCLQVPARRRVLSIQGLSRQCLFQCRLWRRKTALLASYPPMTT